MLEDLPPSPAAGGQSAPAPAGGTEVGAPPARKGGRPPKFTGPCRPVTVTLPENTLNQLAGIDQDRAQAIVKAVSSYGGWSPAETGVSFVPVSPEAGLLLLKPCRTLHDVPGLTLVEIVPGRFLLVLAPGTPTESLELALGDRRESLPAISGGDREIIEQLLAILRRSRRSQHLETSSILLVGTPASP